MNMSLVGSYTILTHQ